MDAHARSTGAGRANGWRVAGKVAAALALPLLVQAGGAIWWAAAADQRIAANAREADANRQDIRAALALLQARLVEDGRRDQRLDDLARQVADIRRTLERIDDRLAKRP
jgi:hypothetical protein